MGGPSGPGVPKKGTNNEYKDYVQNCSLTCLVLKLRFLAFPQGPGGFRELREACRNHFHLSWYLLVPGDYELWPKTLLGGNGRSSILCISRPSLRE